MTQESNHTPVLFNEVVDMLNLSPGQTVLDATLGLAGHAQGIIKKILPGGTLIGLDKDSESLQLAKESLGEYSKECIFVHSDYRNLDEALEQKGVEGVDAVLFDLGLSSYQLENPVRGFSFRTEGPLDMRMDRKSFISAYDLVNNLTEEEISSILWRYGQERYSYRIARRLIQERQKCPISSTKQLAEMVLRISSRHAKKRYRIHPATRTFQALRIAVNRELDALDEALKKAALFLNKGGRICVISFHSLEDKIAKENFRSLAKTGQFQLINKKVLRPSLEEIQLNARSRSAKMRVIERIR